MDDSPPRHGADAGEDRESVLTRVAVIGATGQLGSDLVEAFRDADVTALAHDDLELGDPDAVAGTIERLRPAIVVNAAAFHNVPRCENEPSAAYALNAIAPRHLARCCTAAGARLVHVSTDYVFDGTKGAPYVETDRPNPLNVYASSKLAGEYGVLNDGAAHQVVRSSGLYGVRPCRAKGGNFIDTMFRLVREQDVVRVVQDEVLTPTFTADLAAQIRVLAEQGPPGLFHATEHGACSWYEFATVIFAVAGFSTPLEPTTVKAYAAPVRRPFYSVLDNAALREADLDRMRPWRVALEDYLERRAAATRAGAASRPA